MFFTCKQVSNQLAREDYAKLPRVRKLTLILHVLICPVCGAYNRQVMKFQDLARLFRKREEQLLEKDGPELPKDARDRMRKRLEKEKERGL